GRARASPGEAPPVPIGTTTSPRSTMAGKMNVESPGRSTTLMGIRWRRARAAICASSASPAAETTTTASLKSALSGSPKLISSRPCPDSGNIASATSASRENQRTCAPAARSRRTCPSASSPEPTTMTTPAAVSRNTGRNRIARSVRGLTSIIFYIIVETGVKIEKYYGELPQENRKYHHGRKRSGKASLAMMAGSTPWLLHADAGEHHVGHRNGFPAPVLERERNRAADQRGLAVRHHRSRYFCSGA